MGDIGQNPYSRRHIQYPPNDEVLDDFERKHILEIRPSVTLAKNVKRKVLVRGSKLISLRWSLLVFPYHRNRPRLLKFLTLQVAMKFFKKSPWILKKYRIFPFCTEKNLVYCFNSWFWLVRYGDTGKKLFFFSSSRVLILFCFWGVLHASCWAICIWS